MGYQRFEVRIQFVQSVLNSARYKAQVRRAERIEARRIKRENAHALAAPVESEPIVLGAGLSSQSVELPL